MKARAPSAMNPACWLKSSKKFPSRGSSLPNSIASPPSVLRHECTSAHKHERRGDAPSATIAPAPNRTGVTEQSTSEPQADSAADDSTAVLRVRKLACRRGDRLLFEPTSFTVAAGTIAWIRGANGQGKTTLLRTLAGLAAPAAGTIW